MINRPRVIVGAMILLLPAAAHSQPQNDQLNPKPIDEDVVAGTPGATAQVRPSELYGDEMGIATRQKLNKELMELRIQMAVLNRAAGILDKAQDGSGRNAIIHNLVKLKALESLSRALPLVARTVEDHRWDMWLQIDAADFNAARLRDRAGATEKRIQHLVEATLEAEEQGASRVRINSLKKELSHRLTQHDAQTLDADEAEDTAGERRNELTQLATLDELLDGIALEKGVFAEMLQEGIEREIAVAAQEQLANDFEDINEMIVIFTAAEVDSNGRDVVKRSPNISGGEVSIMAELTELEKATRLKDTSRVESLLERARQARHK